MTQRLITSGMLLGLFLLMACMPLAASNPVGARTTNATADAPSTLPSTCTQHDTPFEEQVRQAQREVKLRFGELVHTAWGNIDFHLLLPTNTVGYISTVMYVTEKREPPVVSMCLVDTRNAHNWIGIGQSVGGFGALGGDMRDWQWEAVRLQSGAARLGRGTDHGSGERLVLLLWDQHGISYVVSGHRVSIETVVSVANSLHPCCLGKDDATP